MTTTAASLQPLKPAASTSLDNPASSTSNSTSTSTGTPTGSIPQTSVPASTKQKGEAHGFGILQHTGPPVQDDVPGLYRDGRVRNPVPSKLKGKTDARKGNFGVMHIDLSTTNETQERDAAAKRTSEGTQLAAKLAQTDRYVPIKRSKFLYRPNDQATPSPPQPEGTHQRTLPLTVAETKAEQARLLTLLRSLQPVLVVDQLCKALAFFGGVSRTQPTTDGAFPNSAEANGSGSLFVGWLAEIFPALGQGSIPNAQHPPLKRPRGRPKGSKNTKGKKDKLARKRFGSRTRLAGAAGDGRAGSSLAGETAIDDSWADIDDGVAENEENGPEGELERNPTTPSYDSRISVGPNTSGHVLGNCSAETAAITPTPKRRGRPKGSKNRPKNKTILAVNTHKNQDIHASMATGSAALPNRATDSAGSLGTSIPSSAPTGPIEPEVLGVRKRKPGPGRPKGSKNRPKEPASAFEHDPQPTSAVTNVDHQGQRAHTSVVEGAFQPTSAVVIAPLAQTEQPQQQPQNFVPTMPTQSVPVPAREAVAARLNAEVGSKGIKRKRKAVQEDKATKSDDIPSTAAQAPTQSPAEAVTTVTSHSGSSPQVVRYQDSPNQDNIHAYQPAKRQKVPGELRQEHVLNSHINQAIRHSSQTPEPDTSADHYDANLGGADGSSLHRSRSQIKIAASQFTLQQTPNTQQAQPDPPVRYSQNIMTTATGQQTERSKATGTYTMGMSGRTAQGMYNQVRPSQSQYGQQQQPPPLHNRPNANQRRLANSSTGQIASTAGHDGSPYTTSTSDGGYRRLTSVQQPSFNAQMAVPATTQEASYRSPASRSMQHHSPVYQARQAHQAQNSGLAFQDYSDSAFLEMAELDSASQASLNMNPTSYGINGGNMQRASPTMNSSYGSASSMGHSSFDGGLTESALRERMYHTLRRQ